MITNLNWWFKQGLIHILLASDWHPQDHVSFACNHEGGVPFTTIKLDNGLT